MIKSLQKQNGSTTIVVMMLMLSFLIFSYHVYDLSRAYLSSIVSLNVSDQVADLYLIGDNETQNKSKMSDEIAKYSGIHFSYIDKVTSYSSQSNVSHDEFMIASVDNTTKISPKLTKGILENKTFYNETKTEKVKKFSDLNVVIVASDSSGNRGLIDKYKEPLKQAIDKLMSKSNSNLSIIPYGYRLLQDSRCYSVIERGDGFSFPWWEDYHGEVDYLNSLKSDLENAKNHLSSVNNSINSTKSKIESTRQELASESDPEIKDQLEAELESLENHLDDLYDDRDDTEDRIDDLEEKVEDQQAVVDNLENTSTFKKYRALDLHYVKKNRGGEEYSYFDDYTDEFLSENNYTFTKNDAYESSINLDSISSLYDESVKNNSAFGVESTCPNASISKYKDDTDNYYSTFNNMGKNASYVSLIQGLGSGMKVAFAAPKKRTVIFYMIDQNDDYLLDQDEKNTEKTIANRSCQKTRDSYINDIAVKNVFLTSSQSGEDYVSELSCQYNSLLNGESNIINYSDYGTSNDVSDRILYELLQESSSSKYELELN